MKKRKGFIEFRIEELKKKDLKKEQAKKRLKRHINKKPGLYILCRSRDKVVHKGQSLDLYRRFLEHLKKNTQKWTRISFFIIKKSKLPYLDELEALILRTSEKSFRKEWSKKQKKYIRRLIPQFCHKRYIKSSKIYTESIRGVEMIDL